MIAYLPVETLGEVPLEAATWRALLAELVEEIAVSDAAAEVARLREGYVLLSRAPAAAAARIAPLPVPETFAGWLAAGACETAALALLGEAACYMASRGADGRHLATVVLAPDREHSAAGATLALALLAALAQAVLAQSEGAAAPARVLH